MEQVQVRLVLISRFFRLLIIHLYQALVEDLYKFRDHFFESHAIEDAHLKHGMVKDKLKETLAALDTIKIEEKSVGESSEDYVENVALRPGLDDKAKALYFRGRALNVTVDHDPESEAFLSKAVKLEPSFAEAWNELGESYWKRNQVSQAQNCFEGALNHVRFAYPL